MSAESFFQRALAKHGEDFEITRSGRTSQERGLRDFGGIAFLPGAGIEAGDEIVGAVSHDSYRVLSTKSEVIHGRVLRIIASVEPLNVVKSATAGHTINVGSIQGGSIMVDSPGGQQTINYRITSIEEKGRVENILREVASIIDALGLSGDNERYLKAEKATIEAQLKRKEPKRSIIADSLKSIRGLLGKAVTAASTTATEAAIKHVPELIEHIDRQLRSWGG